MRKRFFVEMLREICKEEGFVLEIFSHEWLCKVTDPESGKFTWTYGYNFRLNSSVAHMIANDKVATSKVLSEHMLANVEHFQIFNSEVRKDMLIDKSLDEEIGEAVSKFGFPLVVKPNMGTLGRNVFLCNSITEVRDAINLIDVKDSAAICKYYASDFEYRFYILDGEILIAYKKVKSDGNWKHNLSQGASAETLEPSQEIKVLALRAFEALGLRSAAVDVLDTKEGYKVLEVNSGIAMDKFAGFSKKNHLLAKEAHRKMLLRSMGLDG